MPRDAQGHFIAAKKAAHCAATPAYIPHLSKGPDRTVDARVPGARSYLGPASSATSAGRAAR